MRLVFCDTETGGLSPETDALLSIGLADWVDGQILDTTEIFVDPEGLVCGAKAMEVNGIDLDVHLAYSVSRSDAAKLLRDWCRPRGRVILAGHNLGFDLAFLKPLFGPGMWSASFSHRVLDTMQVLLFLGHAGLIPEGIGKLDQAIAHFGLAMPEGKRHTALADALATAELYSRLLQVISGVAA